MGHDVVLYIQSLYKSMQMTKISLHDPDSKHIDEQHFRLAFEHPIQAVTAVNAGGGW
jgi:IMP cyclohydrolase